MTRPRHSERVHLLPATHLLRYLPFHTGGSGLGPCNFFFENGLYPRPAVFRANDTIPLSKYELILRELGTQAFHP